MNRRLLAAQAVRQAALVRSQLEVGIGDSVCPFDLAQRIGLSTRFLQAPSLEGMYSPEPLPTIIVGSERPSGRQRFTCGHEIGHHIFRHGTCIDEADHQSGREEEEFLANQFAAALLMSRVAVDAAFSRRGVIIGAATATEVLEVSQDLGVGFATLVNHLEFTLHSVRSDLAEDLRRMSLPKLRKAIAGIAVPYELFVVNNAWGARPLDMQVGDIALVSPGATYTGSGGELVSESPWHIQANDPGVGNLTIPGREKPIVVRVARRTFAGLARYRYLEDCPDD